MVDVPRVSHAVTASWLEESDDAHRRLLFHARHSDLVVLGRPSGPDELASDPLEFLLMDCGRPVVLACSTAPRTLTGVVMVCWRETADAARAVAAAMPLLTKAERVIFAAVDEGGGDPSGAAQQAASQFRWNGIATEVQIAAAHGRPVAEVLAALAKNRGADLLVMGAYGHSRTREWLLGGCTRAMTRSADLPVLLMH